MTLALTSPSKALPEALDTLHSPDPVIDLTGPSHVVTAAVDTTPVPDSGHVFLDQLDDANYVLTDITTMERVKLLGTGWKEEWDDGYLCCYRVAPTYGDEAEEQTETVLASSKLQWKLKISASKEIFIDYKNQLMSWSVWRTKFRDSSWNPLIPTTSEDKSLKQFWFLIPRCWLWQ